MELRVFISSTFRDLEDERQHLAKKVFPAIRQLCRSRGIEFTEIDLRWGLTEEEARNGKVIRNCLEEIDRCRPYFIGILGSRYGWVPEFHEIQRDAELLHKYPWIEDAALERKSLVEIEFDHGALADAAAAEFAFFYTRREHSRHQHLYSDVSKEETEQLSVLRERIRKSRLPLRDFSGPESLGEQVYDDLAAIIERNWSSTAERSPLERERSEHEAFAASRRHAYIASPVNIKALSAAAKSGKSLVIYAPSGTGKSALLAYWAHSFRDRNADSIVIEYYSGIGSGADHIGVLLYLFGMLKEQLGIEEPIPTEAERLLGELPAWLLRAGAKKLVIVIDALNQLDERSHSLAWLPEHLPENVSIVTSTTSNEMAATLEAKGFGRLNLLPLSIEEREAMIVRFLSEYHKGLDTDDLKRISIDPKSASPLFLRTLLEELRVGGNFEHLDSIIDHYLTAKDTDELFQIVLERLEEDYGARTVRDVMGLIWASRAGLAERELGELINISRLRLSALVMALDYHLHRRDGLFTFFHEYLQRAVEARYASDGHHKKHFHERIARYMREQPPTERRADEEPWQWMQIGNDDELRKTLTDSELLPELLTSERRYNLLRYWQRLATRFDLVTEYTEVLRLTNEKKGKLEYARLLKIIANFYITASKYYDANPLFEELLSITSDLYGTASRELAEALEEYGTLLYEERSYDLSEEKNKSALAINTQLFGQESKQALKNLADLGAVLILKGKLDEAEAIYRRIIPITESRSGVLSHEVASNINNLADILRQKGEREEALKLFQESLRINETMFGELHPIVASNYDNIGTTYRELSQSEEAAEAYTHAVEIRTRTLGEHHPDTLISMDNLALTLRALGKYSESRTLHEIVLHERERIFGPKHLSTLYTLQNLSALSRAQNGVEAAFPFYKEVIERGHNVLPEFTIDRAKIYLGVLQNENRLDLASEFKTLLQKFNIEFPQE